MKTIKLSKKKWLRGEGNFDSFLLRSADRKMCCMGIACSELGYSEPDLEDTGCVDELLREDVGTPIPPEFLPLVDDESLFNNLYSINDDQEIVDDKARVALLNGELERIDADFRFELEN